MKVIDSICPGCSLQCGVHIVEEDGLGIEFMKHCPVNQGKLCKFGVMLPEYYSTPLSKSYVAGKEVARSDAVGAAVRALTSATSGVIVALGDSTNEELMAMSMLASGLDMKMATGMGASISAIGDLKIAANSVTLEDIENASSIVIIDVDPYVQYPLLARRLQIARDNGAAITYVGPGCLNIERIASESHIVSPNGILHKLEEIDIIKGSIFIASCGIYSNAPVAGGVAKASLSSNGKTFFLKDFANSEAAVAMGIESFGDTIENLMVSMENGSVKSLVLVDSPLYESYIDDMRFRNACEKLEAFVVIQSMKPKVVPVNAIVIPIDPFYQRRGTLLSAEGVLHSVSGNTTGSFDVINEIMFLMGKKALDYDAASSSAADAIKAHENNVMPADRSEEIGSWTVLHCYVSNPYLVRGMAQGLAKRCNKELYEKVKESSRYVVAGNVVDGVVLAYDKDPRYTGPITELK